VSPEEFLGFFAGLFREIGVSPWYFCGRSVVNCVANVETEMHLNDHGFSAAISGLFCGKEKAAAEAAAP
jgi:hypothetical protein